MNKDFVRIANDVMTGVGMLRQGSPDTMKAFAADRRRSMAPTRSAPTTSSATSQRPREHA